MTMLLVRAWDNGGEAAAGGVGWASHVILAWDAWEPTAGRYRYDLIDQALYRYGRSQRNGLVPFLFC